MTGFYYAQFNVKIMNVSNMCVCSNKTHITIILIHPTNYCWKILYSKKNCKENVYYKKNRVAFWLQCYWSYRVWYYCEWEADGRRLSSVFLWRLPPQEIRTTCWTWSTLLVTWTSPQKCPLLSGCVTGPSWWWMLWRECVHRYKSLSI